MSNWIKLFIAVVIGVLILIIGLNRTDHSTTICISGSTTISPFMRKMVSAYREKKDIEITVSSPGSIAGIKALISGACDLAMSSTEIPPELRKAAEDKGILLKAYLLGYDIIVPVVHPDNPVEDISLKQLKAVFSGKIQRWKTLGGGAGEIAVVNRSENSGTCCAFYKRVDCTECEKTLKLSSNSAVLGYVATHRPAIGYISRSYLNPEVKALAVDGVNVTHNGPSAKNYPIKRPLYLYADQNRLDHALKAFIIYILVSEQGRSIFRNQGFLPGDSGR